MDVAIRSVAAVRKTVITTTRGALLASHLRRYRWHRYLGPQNRTTPVIAGVDR